MASHLITFAANPNNKFPAIHKASKRLRLQASKSNLFDTIVEFTDEDLQTDNHFWLKHKEFIKNNPKGFGYWLWKPYIIKTRLSQIEDGDVLTYLDCGCEILPSLFDQKSNFISEIKLAGLLAYTQNFEIHCKRHTKEICYNFFNTTEAEFGKNNIYFEANRIFLVKNDITKHVVEEWWSVMDSNYEIYDNSVTNIPEKDTFVESRHDQMIFNFVLHKNNLLNTKTERKSEVKVNFVAWRNKTGQSKLCKKECVCCCCVV